MKKIISLFASIIFFVNAEAQYTSRNNVSDFNAIEISSAARVNLVQSDSDYVTLSSKDSIKKAPKMEVKDGVLEIASPFKGTIDVHVKNITSIRVSDAARVRCKDTLNTNNLTVHVSDAARADILVHAKTIKTRANDAGSITLSGTADSLDIKVSDASHVNASSLKAGVVKVNSSDGSNADVWAINSIDANASDGSRINIKGNPTQKNTSASDGGSVTMNDTGDEITQFNGNNRFMRMSKDSNSKKRFEIDGDAFIGMGFITGASSKGAPILYGRSREFMMGLGYVKKIVNWNWIGLDVYYKSTDYFLAQNSSKSFPDSANHQAQKISFQNFGGLIFDRFIFGKKLFLDGGLYGDWTFHSKLITWDDNTPNVSSTKTVDRNPSFVNADNYGLTFRFGQTKGVSLYFNYRLSSLFQAPAVPTAAYPALPIYVVGINFGSF